MKRFAGFLIAALLALVPAVATAAVTTTGAGKVPSSAPPAFSGPLDVVSGLKAVYSLRAGSAAIAAAGTQKLVQAQRASTSETCDVLVATSGDMGNTANCSGSSNGTPAATFCNATTCSVIIWYDQTSNHFDAGGGVPPTLAFNCQNGKPCVVFNGSQYLVATTATSTSSPLTISAVAVRTAGTGQSDILVGTNGAYFFGTSPSQAAAYFGSQQASNQTDGAYHSMQFVSNSTSSNIMVDGVAGSTFDLGTGTISANFELGAQGGASFPCTCQMTEVLLNAAAFTATPQTNMTTNQRSYWGF